MNPQLENGYTSLANELLEELIKINLSGQELRSCLFVIRKTYGYHKKEDFISLSQFQLNLSISKIRASQIIKVLVERKILTVTKNINGLTKCYMFNKQYNEWKTVNKNINRIEKPNETVKVFLNPPLRKILTTKETLTKERKKEKETPQNSEFNEEELNSIINYFRPLILAGYGLSEINNYPMFVLLTDIMELANNKYNNLTYFITNLYAQNQLFTKDKAVFRGKLTTYTGTRENAFEDGNYMKVNYIDLMIKKDVNYKKKNENLIRMIKDISKKETKKTEYEIQ